MPAQSSANRIAQVAITQAGHALLGRVYSYAIPENWQRAVSPGVWCWVPLGTSKTPLRGVVLSVESVDTTPALKPLWGVALESPTLAAPYLSYLTRLTNYYGCSLGEAISAAVPAALQPAAAPKNGFRWKSGRPPATAQQHWTPEARQLAQCLEAAPAVYTVEEALELSGFRQKQVQAQLSNWVKQGVGVWVNPWELPLPSEASQLPLEALWVEPVAAEILEHRLANAEPRLRKHRKKLLAFMGQPACLASQLATEWRISASTLRAMLAATLLQQAQAPKQWEAIALPANRPALTAEQQNAFETINAKLTGKHLVWGVTGSGKTELYFYLLEAALAEAKSGLVLLPEIALTQALLSRFTQRFGERRVLVWHSQVTPAVKREQWYRLTSGEPLVIIGARSAALTPVSHLGVVVVDEAHDDSFKQESPAPRYDARLLAEWLGEANACPVVLGTATPSVTQWARAVEGDWHLHTLKQRYQNKPLPVMELVAERPEPGYSSLTRPLIEALNTTLEAEQQAIVLLNRRGYHTQMQCMACGTVLECPHCSVALTYHKALGLACCHQCDYRQLPPEFCPNCASPSLTSQGLGTQRLEEELAQALGEAARIVRLDGDVMRSKQAFREVMGRFTAGEANVLVGTQLVAKGLHIPKVTLVGVVQADAGLAVPDFKAQERLFQLLTQVAGRAGRGEWPGKVLLQVFRPEHPVLRLATANQAEAFYPLELGQREAFAYPPYSQLLRFVVRGEEEQRVKFFAEALKAHAVETLTQQGMVAGTHYQAQGPAVCQIARLKNQWRYHFLIKNLAGDTLRETLVEWFRSTKAPAGLHALIDVDAESLL